MRVRKDSRGYHFFDRQTGLNLLVDEVVPPAEERHLAPRHLSIAITNECDLSCSYCYAPKRPSQLTAEMVVELAMEADANGTLGVGLGGGEPTLHPSFAKICERIASETKLAVSFTTHGHAIDDALARELSGNVNFIRISVDGHGDVYNELRGRPFSSVLQALNLVRGIAPFGLNIVINDRTIGSLDALSLLAESAGASELLLLPQRPISTQTPFLRTRLTQWIRQYTGSLRLAVSTGARLTGADLFPPDQQCDLEAFAHVSANGLVRASAFGGPAASLNNSLISALAELKNHYQGAI